MNDLDVYRVVRQFECCGDIIVVVEAPHGIHTMTEKEWKSIESDLDRNHRKTSKCCCRREINVA